MNIAEPPQSELVAAQQLLGPLQHRIRQLEAIIEHLPCGVAVFDAEQRHVITNLRARQMLNVPAQVLEGPDVTFASLARFLAERGEYGPGDAESLVADRVRRLRERDPRKPERLRTNGMVIEVRGGPMPDGSVVTTYTDVTAERRAASELKTSRERLARALEASDLGLWEYDTRTRKVYLSSGWASMFGLPAQDLHLEYAEMGRFVPVQENTALQDARIRLLKGETTRMS